MTIAFSWTFLCYYWIYLLGFFHSSAVLADAIHDTGDAWRLVYRLLRSISTRKEDRDYTLDINATACWVPSDFWWFCRSVRPGNVNVHYSLLRRWICDGMLVWELSLLPLIQQLAENSHGHSHNESVLACIFLRIFWATRVVGVSIILRFNWLHFDPAAFLIIAGFILCSAKILGRISRSS